MTETDKRFPSIHGNTSSSQDVGVDPLDSRFPAVMHPDQDTDREVVRQIEGIINQGTVPEHPDNKAEAQRVALVKAGKALAEQRITQDTYNLIVNGVLKDLNSPITRSLLSVADLPVKNQPEHRQQATPIPDLFLDSLEGSSNNANDDLSSIQPFSFDEGIDVQPFDLTETLNGLVNATPLPSSLNPTSLSQQLDEVQNVGAFGGARITRSK